MGRRRRMRGMLAGVMAVSALLGGGAGCAPRPAGLAEGDARAAAAVRALRPEAGGVAAQTQPAWGGAMPPPFAPGGGGTPVVR